MTLTYIKGDITKSGQPHIAHGCNAQGVMGSGVALAIKKRFPWAFEKYHQTIMYAASRTNVGDCIPATNETGVWVFNLITQEFYGRDTTIRYMSYDGLERSLKAMRREFECCCLPKIIAMPKIGSGLGNGDWLICETIILRTLQDFDITIYHQD